MSDGNGSPKTTPLSQAKRLDVRAEDSVARGVYSNSAMVNVTENEVTIDFVYVAPHAATGHLQSRVILTPRQAKLLTRVLQDSIRRYEERFGPIPAPAGASTTSTLH